MSDLNLSLWGAGCVVILAVIFYNFWQEYKAKKNVERAFGQHQDDVLMQPGDGTVNSSATLKENNVTSARRQEPSLGEVQTEPKTPAQDSEGQVTTQEEAASLPVDDFIDCVITMEFETAVRGDK